MDIFLDHDGKVYTADFMVPDFDEYSFAYPKIYNNGSVVAMIQFQSHHIVKSDEVSHINQLRPWIFKGKLYEDDQWETRTFLTRAVANNHYEDFLVRHTNCSWMRGSDGNKIVLYERDNQITPKQRLLEEKGELFGTW